MNHNWVRFNLALQYAAWLHRDQERKITRAPYVSHLIAVAAIVMDYGADEDTAIAALLHDAVEDQGGLETYNEIEKRFGCFVADTVMGCSDSWETPKRDWKERKDAFLVRLKDMESYPVRLIVAADKLDNARAILRALASNPHEQVWEHFKGGRAGTLWYLWSVAEILECDARLRPMVLELAGVLEEITNSMP